MLFRFDNVTKHYGSNDVLDELTCQLNPGERIGLVGRNGAGKTTMFRLLAGSETPDKGQVIKSNRLRVGYLNQIPVFDAEKSLREVALGVFEGLRKTESRLRELEHLMADSPPESLDTIFEEYSTLQHRYEEEGGFTYAARAEAVLQGVGFDQSDFSMPAGHLSGGQKSRLALARLLLSAPDLLLLDEPTNHLDLMGVEWLEQFLLECKSAFVIISHDRFFLDRVVGQIWELSGGRITAYKGGYTAYVEGREVRRQIEVKRYREQQEFIEKTKDFIRRNLAGQKTKQAQSRRRQLEKIELLDRPSSDQAVTGLALRNIARTGSRVLEFDHVSVGYGSKVILEDLECQVYRGDVLGVLGPNGAGKTTLARTLIGKIKPIRGEVRWGTQVKIGYLDQELTGLHPASTVLGELRGLDMAATDEHLRSFLGGFLFSEEDVFQPVKSLSGGERARLALAKLVYDHSNVLVLDEPTNHLDIHSREALEAALSKFEGTTILISHDRYLLKELATKILFIDGGRGCFIEGDYENYERWRAARRTAVQTTLPVASVEKAKTETMSRKKTRTKLKGSVSAPPPEAIEGEISTLEARLAEISEQIREATKASNSSRITELLDEYSSTEKRIEELFTEWSNVCQSSGSSQG